MDPTESPINPQQPNGQIPPTGLPPQYPQQPIQPQQQPQPQQPQPYQPGMPKLVPFGPGVAGAMPQPMPTNPNDPTAPAQQQPGLPPVGGGYNATDELMQQHGSIPEPGVAYGNYGYKPPRSARKLLLLILLPLLLIVGGAAAFYFAYYQPNTPQGVFRSGLSRTGIALDRLATTSREESQVDKFKSSEISGSAVIEGPDGRQSGTFTSQYDEENSSSKLTYSPDNKGKDLELQVLSDMPAGTKYPDIYFMLSGMSAIKLNDIYPGVDQYEGKWINAAPAFWESMIPQTATDDKATDDTTFTEQDFNALLKIAITTSNEYVFTSDKSKNVLVMKTAKGTETVEGQSTYRYLVGFNKDHYQTYCKTLADRIISAPAYKHIPAAPQDDLDQVKKDAAKSCEDSAKQIKDSDTIDLWISRKTKLVSQVRSYDEKDKGNYVDVGQKYVSGDSIPLYTVWHSDKDKYNVKMTLDIDFAKSDAKATVAADYVASNKKDKWKINVTLSSKPHEGDVKITKPKVSVPVNNFLDTIGLGGTFDNGDVVDAPTDSPLGSAQSKAKDTERQTDLRALQGQLEAFFAQNGYYPSLADVNNATWRKTNMQGLDAQALADPDGKLVELLAGKSNSTMYGYELADCDASSAKCQGYTLTSMLSTGSLFTLNSLN